jgi:soluble lytic murein transglycosylase
LEKLKRKELATQLFNDVNFKFPYTYYGIRSGEKGNKKMVSKLNNNQEMSINNPELSSNAQFHYSRSVELAATGFYEDARHEISNVEKSVRKNFSGVIWLTSLYNDAHAYSDTVRILQLYKNFKTKIGEKELSYDFWKNFYPPAYDKTIRDISKNLGVSPYFVQGLIRQESLFNAKVQSRAGAIGLMQIMPKTGRSLHANSNMTEPFKTDILFDPGTNIQLGIQYIHQLKNRFKKNKTHVLISYNAGPHNLKKWLTRFKHINDPDVFIESIPYPETRKYVKKVLRNYGIYKTLYTDMQP